MNPLDQVERFRAQFQAEGTPERAAGAKAYLKSRHTFYGVSIPQIRAAARAFQKENRALTRGDLRALVEALWETDEHELRSLGAALLEVYAKLLTSGEIDLVERLIRRCHTWDLLDWLATGVSAALVDRDPALKERLVLWAADPNFWVRRAALLSLLEPLRRGKGDFELFSKLAVPMLTEKEFFIRKAIGWVLREISKRRPELTHGFLREHLRSVSGLTLREGARHLPAPMRDELMALRG